MKLWVVWVDAGLGGSFIHGVYSTRPDPNVVATQLDIGPTDGCEWINDTGFDAASSWLSVGDQPASMPHGGIWLAEVTLDGADPTNLPDWYSPR